MCRFLGSAAAESPTAAEPILSPSAAFEESPDGLGCWGHTTRGKATRSTRKNGIVVMQRIAFPVMWVFPLPYNLLYFSRAVKCCAEGAHSARAICRTTRREFDATRKPVGT